MIDGSRVDPDSGLIVAQYSAPKTAFTGINGEENDLGQYGFTSCRRQVASKLWITCGKFRTLCQVAALFYSLIETAKVCGIDPKTHLLLATTVALEVPWGMLPPHDLVDSDPASG